MTPSSTRPSPSPDDGTDSTRLLEPSVDARVPGAGLPCRLRGPRVMGLGLGALVVAATWWPRGASPLMWSLLALHGLAWPWIACAWSSRQADPRRAEHRNIVVDASAGGAWLASMHFTALPGAALAAMLAMNGLAVGGPALLRRCVAGMALGAGAGAVLTGGQVELAAAPLAAIACVPFLLAYPLSFGLAQWRLATRLAAQREALQHSERFHRDTLDAMQAAIVVYGPDDRILLCNEDFRRLYAPLADDIGPGVRFETLLRRALVHGLVPEARGREQAWLDERLAAHREPAAPHDRRMPDGRWRRIFEQRLPGGGLLAFSTDITELMHTTQALRAARSQAERERQRLEDAIAALPDGIALYDASDRLIVWNAAYEALHAQAPELIRPGATYESVLRAGLAQGWYPDAAGHEDEWLAQRLRQHRWPEGAQLQVLRGDRWIRINESRTREGGLVGLRTDVTDLVRREHALRHAMEERDAYAAQLRAANDRLEALSTTDPLTQLGNRRLLDRRLAEEWQRARRHGHPVSLLMIDVDHFKAYNDRYGHPAGDACLRRIGAVLRRLATRASDLVVRYGGEEFVVLMPHADRAAAEQAAAACLAAVAAEGLVHEASPVAPHVTVSIGVTTSERHGLGDGPAHLLHVADQGLYVAKRAGRARWSLPGAVAAERAFPPALPAANDDDPCGPPDVAGGAVDSPVR